MENIFTLGVREACNFNKNEVAKVLWDTLYNHLESVDRSHLRKILETGACTPKVMFYLKMGVHPIKYVIMNRHVMFLHYILKSEGTMLFKFLMHK